MVHRHISDVDTWGNPDRNYFVFVALSLVLGFIGADHFYLRSFGTGTQKLITNFFTLGFWYWWDLIQILTDGQKVRKEGLAGPLDWIQGIGRGVFKPIPAPADGPVYEAEKSYLVYAFLAIFFGWLGADKFYLGEGWQGIAKLLSCFNIFLFLFGWLWCAWDAFHAFFMTESILKDGVSAPMPYSMVFSSSTSGDVFKVKEAGANGGNAKSSSSGILDWIARTFGFPDEPQGVSWRSVYRELVAPLFTPPVVKALHEVQAVSAAVPTAAPAAPAPAPAAPAPAPAATLNIQVTAPSPAPVQAGGGASASGPGPVIAGALTAVVLAGGLKGFYDFISKQYGQ